MDRRHKDKGDGTALVTLGHHERRADGGNWR